MFIEFCFIMFENLMAILQVVSKIQKIYINKGVNTFLLFMHMLNGKQFI